MSFPVHVPQPCAQMPHRTTKQTQIKNAAPTSDRLWPGYSSPGIPSTSAELLKYWCRDPSNGHCRRLPGAGKKRVNGGVIALGQHQSEKPSPTTSHLPFFPTLPVRITVTVMTVARNYFTFVMDTCGIPWPMKLWSSCCWFLSGFAFSFFFGGGSVVVFFGGLLFPSFPGLFFCCFAFGCGTKLWCWTWNWCTFFF